MRFCFGFSFELSVGRTEPSAPLPPTEKKGNYVFFYPLSLLVCFLKFFFFFLVISSKFRV